MRVFIHSGHLSLDNGAKFPMTQFKELAKLLDVAPDYGDAYGQDSLEIAEADWPIVEDLLREGNMLYLIQGVHERWQNVRTPEVRDRLRLPQTTSLN